MAEKFWGLTQTKEQEMPFGAGHFAAGAMRGAYRPAASIFKRDSA
jgi:hypothetical protein